MSEIVSMLATLDDIVPEGITFDLLGYESLTGIWYMEFKAFDEMEFLPRTQPDKYSVCAETFLKDIESNIERFIKVYNKHKPG